MKMRTIILILVLGVLVACKDDSVKFGTVEHYNSFLWSDAKTVPVEKTFEFDFSEDAVQDDSYAILQFVDNQNKPVSTDIMQVSISGKLLKDNKIRIKSDVKRQNFTFTFTNKAKDGTYQGYLRLVDHQLDRVDSQDLTQHQPVNVLQWTIDYNVSCNPVLKVSLLILGILVFLLLLWFLILQKVFYPQIRLSRIELKLSDGQFLSKRIRKARCVMIGSNRQQQSRLNRLFTGRIVYIVNAAIPSAFELIPAERRKRAVKINLHSKYILSPASAELTQFGKYELTHIETNQKLTLNTN